MPNRSISAISTVRLSSTSTIITFTSIPQSFKDLQIKCSLRFDTATTNELASLFIRFNSYTATDYTYKLLYAESTTINSITALNAENTRIGLGYISGNQSNANVYAVGDFYIGNYSGSEHKNINSGLVIDDNYTTASRWSLFQGTAKLAITSAITSIELISSSATSRNFIEHSSATLYGIQ